MLRKCLIAIVFAALAACGTSPEAPNGYVFSVDSAGRYPVMRSSGTPPVWSSPLLATIGTANGSASELGRVRSVLLSPAGDVFVVDAGYTRLVKFNASGSFAAQWGRKGSGPGEYLSPYSIAWLHDSLVLLDPANSRMGMYDTQGRWVRSWPSPRITGSVYFNRMPPDAFWSYDVRRNGDRLDGIFVRFTSAGPTDTLPTVRPDPNLVEAAVCNTPDKALHFFQAPFAANFFIMPTPTGERAVALSSHYRIAFINAAGDTTRVFERDVKPVPVSDAEWNDGLQEMKTFLDKWPSATCDRSTFTRTTSKPVIERMFYDDVGQLWVETHTVSGRSYDVFAPTGRLVGSVSELPASEAVEPSVVAGRIAIVVPDSVGFNTIQVFHIRAAQK